MTYKKPKDLFNYRNEKTVKGEKYGYTTYILYLAPHKQNSKRINLCSHASQGCIQACLFGSGSARFDGVQNGKINKTEYFLADRISFLNQIDSEIIKKKNKKVFKDTDQKMCIRLNGTSDIKWEKFIIRDNKNIFDLHPDIQFYDYTKNHLRFNDNLPKNYHLTFSLSETNHDKAFELLTKGHNVAMVFGVKRGEELPKNYKGYKVINGDESDLRFKDEKNVIVGLRYKYLTGKGTKGLNKINLETNNFIIKDFREVNLMAA